MSLSRPTRPTRREWHRSLSRQAVWAGGPTGSLPCHPKTEAVLFTVLACKPGGTTRRSLRKYGRPRTTPPGPWLASEPHEGANPPVTRPPSSVTKPADGCSDADRMVLIKGGGQNGENQLFARFLAGGCATPRLQRR
jgi:hypothetical protein